MCVTIFSTGGKFHPVSIFTQLHALTLIARSYALFLFALLLGFSVKNQSKHMLVGEAMSLFIYNRAKESMKPTALAVGIRSRPTE